jgi:ABC-type proline/glycine betaine transport system ATPase subunit
MILNPEIFLLDEAFGALDFFTKEEIHDELIRIQLLEPRTIIFVTHDLHEAFKIADYIMILNNSEIELFGSKEHVITFRENSFIRKYLEPAIK